MYSKDTTPILQNFTVDSISQNWVVTANPKESFQCYKINSPGCDVLTAQITKSNWAQYDKDQDVSYNAFKMNFNFQTRLNGDTIQFGWYAIAFESIIPAVVTGASGLLVSTSALIVSALLF